MLKKSVCAAEPEEIGTGMYNMENMLIEYQSIKEVDWGNFLPYKREEGMRFDSQEQIEDARVNGSKGRRTQRKSQLKETHEILNKSHEEFKELKAIFELEYMNEASMVCKDKKVVIMSGVGVNEISFSIFSHAFNYFDLLFVTLPVLATRSFILETNSMMDMHFLHSGENNRKLAFGIQKSPPDLQS